MTKPMRELTAKEKRSIRKLVSDRCANYDNECGCLRLGCECPMFGIGYTGSAMCRYFREAVLPNDSSLKAALEDVPVRRCKHCGKSFSAEGRRCYCCDHCAAEAGREQTAVRVRKHRRKVDM